MWFGEPHRLPKEDHLPDWARRDKQGKKGDHVEAYQTEHVGTNKVKRVIV
jgi:hypothetical protein